MPSGTVIGGWTSAPEEVASLPEPSTRSEPSRVSAVRPSVRRTLKKPSPWIATSHGWSVRCRTPWANARPASTAAAPAPVRRPSAEERPACV